MKKHILFLAALPLMALSVNTQAQCNAGEVEVYIDVMTDNFGYETYWELLPGGNACGVGTIFSGGNPLVGCAGGAVQAQAQGGYGNNITITEGPFCLIDGDDYAIEWVDDWGDAGLEFIVIIDGIPSYEFIGAGAGDVFPFTAAVPDPDNAALTSVSVPAYASINEPVVVNGAFLNVGSSDITELEVSWSLDGGTAQSSLITGLFIAPFTSHSFTHPINMTVPTVGAHTIALTIGTVNGNTDPDQSDNSLTMNFEAGEGIPNIIDGYLNVTPTITTIASSSEGVATPRDLDFHPVLSNNELWVINKGTENSGGSTVTIFDAGGGTQTEELKQDGNAWHFMSLPTGIAFSSENSNFCTTTGVFDANHQGGATGFTGPSLWSSDMSIYAEPSGGNGSHLDMLHESPECQGVAHEIDNVFWVFDGYSSDIVRYDFVDDHGPGNDYHADAIVRRYADVTVTKDPNDHIVSGMVLDKETGWLYIVDHGADRVIRMDINTGSPGGAPTYTAPEPLTEYSTVTGYTVEDVVTTGLIQPSGIDIIDNRMIVSDHANGDIIIYDITTMPAIELGRVVTGNPGVMGIKIGPEGKIWFVNATNSTVGRIDGQGLAVDELSLERNVSVYPNPAQNAISISVEGVQIGAAQVFIYDAAGKLVHTENNYTGGQIDISSLDAGMYSVRLLGQEQQYGVARLIVQ